MIENGSTTIMIGFLLDSISSITAVVMSVFILSVLALLALLVAGVLYICLCICCCRPLAQLAKSCFNGCFCGDRSYLKALQRFLSLDWNCPCYRAQPSLRFRLRYIFLLLCLALRSAAIYQYWSVSGKSQ